MDRDRAVEDRVRRAAQPDTVAIERVVARALRQERPRRAGVLVAAAGCAAALVVVTLLAWTSANRPVTNNSRQMMTVVTDEGVTLIFSTEPNHHALPPGTAIIVGGE